MAVSLPHSPKSVCLHRSLMPQKSCQTSRTGRGVEMSQVPVLLVAQIAGQGNVISGSNRSRSSRRPGNFDREFGLSGWLSRDATSRRDLGSHEIDRLDGCGVGVHQWTVGEIVRCPGVTVTGRGGAARRGRSG